MADLRHPPISIDAARWSAAMLPGERILWTGRPRRGVILRASDTMLVPFSLLWGGFAIFWNVTVWRSEADWFFRLWGVPFLLAGLWLIAGRFFTDAWWRGRTWYAVTDRRVLIRSHLLSMQSLDRERLPSLAMEEHSDGTASLWFELRPPLLGVWGNRRGLWSPALDRTPHFERIGDGRRVYEMLSRPT